jgi:hypothetical protein
MNKRILLSVSLITFGAVAQAQDSSLTVSMDNPILNTPAVDWSNAATGFMFDIQTFSKSLNITGFDLRLDLAVPPVTVEIWKAAGSWHDASANEVPWNSDYSVNTNYGKHFTTTTSWSLVGRFAIQDATSATQLMSLSLTTPLTLDANSITGLYILGETPNWSPLVYYAGTPLNSFQDFPLLYDTNSLPLVRDANGNLLSTSVVNGNLVDPNGYPVNYSELAFAGGNGDLQTLVGVGTFANFQPLNFPLPGIFTGSIYYSYAGTSVGSPGSGDQTPGSLPPGFGSVPEPSTIVLIGIGGLLLFKIGSNQNHWPKCSNKKGLV